MTDSDIEIRLAWQQHVGIGHTAERWCESVLDRHRESHRHYHDVRHVRWVVRHALALGSDLADLGVVIAAAFFHDAIYDPRASDNEAASARLAEVALREMGWTATRIQRAARMIEGTADHDVASASAEEAVLYAADLAVLAAEPAGYSDYVRNVRREYRHVADRDWAPGRSAVLRSFLARPSIYAPALALDVWEQRARGNLTAELATLGEAISRDE